MQFQLYLYLEKNLFLINLIQYYLEFLNSHIHRIINLTQKKIKNSLYGLHTLTNIVLLPLFIKLYVV